MRRADCAAVAALAGITVFPLLAADSASAQGMLSRSGAAQSGPEARSGERPTATVAPAQGRESGLQARPGGPSGTVRSGSQTFTRGGSMQSGGLLRRAEPEQTPSSPLIRDSLGHYRPPGTGPAFQTPQQPTYSFPHHGHGWDYPYAGGGLLPPTGGGLLPPTGGGLLPPTGGYIYPGHGVHQPHWGTPSRPIRPGVRVQGPVVVIDRFGVTIFGGYKTAYIPGVSVISPFWIYNAPPFIQTSFVLTTPYPFAHGRPIQTFDPYGRTSQYYTANAQRGAALRAAINDLTRFWEENDLQALRRRISPDFSIAVHQNEQYVYSLRGADFLAMANDAIDRVQTVSMRFTQASDRTDGLVNLYGRHVYRVPGEGTTRTADVRYSLVFVDGDWFISAVSLSTDASPPIQ